MCVRVSVCPTPGGLRVAKCVPVGVQQNVCVYMFFSVCVCVCVCVCSLEILECTKQSYTCAYVSVFICVCLRV